MDALDFSFYQGRTTQLLQTQQLPNSAILRPEQPEQPNPLQQGFFIMELDPNGYFSSCGTSTSAAAVAMDCKHFVQYSDPSALNTQLSGHVDPHGEAFDWEDQFEPTDFVYVPANKLLCNNCEQAMRTELRAARQAYSLIWTRETNSGTDSDESLTQAGRAASKRFVRAAIKVANFEGRMADRENTKGSKEQKWEAGRKVKFAVAEGEGAGEKPKEKKDKSSAIAVGWVEVDQPASPSTQKDDDTSYVFTYRPDQN